MASVAVDYTERGVCVCACVSSVGGGQGSFFFFSLMKYEVPYGGAT